MPHEEWMLGATAPIEERYQEIWLRQVRERGVSDDDLAAALERMRDDKMATLEAQLEWLRRAGFTNVECWYKNLRFAVYAGSKG